MFPHSLAPDELRSYQGAIARSIEVRNHFEVMVWLQGDMQHYLPHDILISAWGNFDSDNFHHDVVSTMVGVRSTNSDAAVIHPLLRELHSRWNKFDRRPYSAKSSIGGFLGDVGQVSCQVGKALQGMRSVIVHGIKDQRGSHCALYVAFAAMPIYDESHRAALALAVPYLDAAMRQVEHLPHQKVVRGLPVVEAPASVVADDAGDQLLSGRESEVLHWVALGKTNPEIGMILGISEFTVKNHLQRLFRKLEVTNRAQAVARLRVLGMAAEPGTEVRGNVVRLRSAG